MHNLDITSAHGISLLVTLIYACAFHMIDMDVWWYILHALTWRVVLVGGCGYLLRRQSVEEFWTRYFINQGRSRQEAFEQWKRLYNFVTTLTASSFGLLAIRLFKEPSSYLSTEFLLCLSVACLLFALQYWSTTSTLRALGAAGWYYGDFFIRDIPFKMTYAGIYRYSNNPDTITSYAAMYGLAILCRSKTLGSIALISQLAQFAFLRFVEMPHTKLMYGEHRRDDAALWRTIKQKLRKARQLQKDPKERDLFVTQLKATAKELTITAKEAVIEDFKLNMSRASADLERMRAWLSARRGERISLKDMLADVDKLTSEIAQLGSRLVRTDRSTNNSSKANSSNNSGSNPQSDFDEDLDSLGSSNDIPPSPPRNKKRD